MNAQESTLGLLLAGRFHFRVPIYQRQYLWQAKQQRALWEEVRNLYVHQYPDLATASITGPEAVGDKLLYRFSRAIGSKG